LIYLKRFGAAGRGALVSTSKFLAQMKAPENTGDKYHTTGDPLFMAARQ
jgi:hypothetical protein